CKNIHIKAQSASASITKNISQDKILKIPIAHSEGRYYADEQTLSTLNSNDQVLFRYCNEAGVIKDDANPNGSLDNIAGICNENKNVFGMMPHPERAVDEILNNSDGRIIFESLLNYVKA
ncbi:MAG: phosphoribosylformylglycinamidine synthase subunit PurQ, partial [Bacteroidia bacterium]|nr:phosphoribosylformylglycinamidine synthase subunit PurQ [Bacteroidia bacterium]